MFLFCITAAEWGRASCIIGGEKRVSNFNGDVTELHVSTHGSLIVTVSKSDGGCVLHSCSNHGLAEMVDHDRIHVVGRSKSW